VGKFLKYQGNSIAPAGATGVTGVYECSLTLRGFWWVLCGVVKITTLIYTQEAEGIATFINKRLASVADPRQRADQPETGYHVIGGTRALFEL